MTARWHNAFSLLELVLVLVIISVALAVVTPSLGGWSRGMKLGVAADEALAATRLARDRAVASGVVHELRVQDATIRVTATQTELVAEDAVTERVFALAEGTRAEALAADGQPAESFNFYPDGRVTPGTLRLHSQRGDTVELVCESPAMSFRRVEPSR